MAKLDNRITDSSDLSPQNTSDLAHKVKIILDRDSSTFVSLGTHWEARSRHLSSQKYVHTYTSLCIWFGGLRTFLSPHIDFLIPLWPSGHQHFISPSLMGKLSPNQTVEGPAELRDLSSLTPFLGLWGLWKGLAPGDPVSSLLCPLPSWHGCAGQMRPQALGGMESAVNLATSFTPYILSVSRQHSSLRLVFILQMGIIKKPAMQFWNELMSSLLITIWIGKYVHIDQTKKGSQRTSSSNPQPLTEEAATFIMFVSPSKEYLHGYSFHILIYFSHILIYFVQMIESYIWGEWRDYIFFPFLFWF